MKKELKEKLLSGKYKITKSGTFKTDSINVIRSDKVQALLKNLEPIPKNS